MKSLPALVLVFVLAVLMGPAACARLNHPRPSQLAAMSGSFAPATPASSHAGFRIATYNVHMESSSAIAQAVEGNEELRVADLLFLQEIEAHDAEGTSRAEQLAELLDMNFAYAPGYALRSGGSHGVAILSRYPLSDLQVIELPYFHVVVNSARRAALAATMDVSGRKVRVYSVHLDNRINPQDRMKQFEPVLEAARAYEGPVVVAGDLNTSPFCWVGNLAPVPCGLQDNAMEAKAKAAALQSPIAKVGATSKWFGMKLDAIYTRELIAVDRAVEHRVRLSDHLPVWLDVELEPETTQSSPPLL